MTKDYTQRNFTVKAVVLSLLLAVLLAASNAYLALKISTTISASIPAAVLSIGIFRLFKRYSVYECNLVQTAASAGEGMAAAVSFVLPGMIIFHFWGHFHYWMTTAIVGLGGLLGVFLSVPLRRVLLSLPDLKYPEGTAIGNVLKISTSNTKGLLKYLLTGIGGGGIVAFLQQGFQFVGSAMPLWAKVRGTLFGITLGFSPAAFAAGFIIGPEVAFSLFIGLVIGWFILIPVLSHWFPVTVAMGNYDAVMTLWSQHLRYVGVGTMLVGGVWTMIKLVRPIVQGIKVSFQVLGKKHLIAEHERDIPMLAMGLGVLIFASFIFCLLAYIFNHLDMTLSFNFTLAALIITLFFIMIVGFLLTTICGYITGIIGSTNSPLSGMVIISVLLLGMIYLGLFNFHDSGDVSQVVGLVLLVATIVAAVAVIGNENFQDLKAGQMIGATPWKQQVMLALGVVASSFVVAPILQLLYNAYGMGGVFPRPGMDPSQMLAAPQASLIGTLAEGIITQQIVWGPILVGVVIALFIVCFDELVCRRHWKFRISILGVGLAIYLPPDLMTALITGGFLHFLMIHLAKKRVKSVEKRRNMIEMANLTACGIVAGSSLMGVFLAIPFAISGDPNILAPAFTKNPHLVWLIGVLGIVSLVAMIKLVASHFPKKGE